MTIDELTQKLREDFPPEALSKDMSRGFELTSIKAMYVIERLNDAFGVFGWSCSWGVMEFRDEEWGTLVELTVRMEEATKIIRQYGGKRVVKTNHTDAKKSAVTDGLTKCASMLGIGHSVFKGKQLSGDAPPVPPETDDKPPEKEKPKGKGNLSDKQIKLVWARAYGIWNDREEAQKELKGILRGRYKIESTKDMTREHLDDYLEYINKVPSQEDFPE